jgi:hypothetical protein
MHLVYSKIYQGVSAFLFLSQQIPDFPDLKRKRQGGKVARDFRLIQQRRPNRRERISWDHSLLVKRNDTRAWRAKHATHASALPAGAYGRFSCLTANVTSNEARGASRE